jgi:hypothetical protein
LTSRIPEIDRSGLKKPSGPKIEISGPLYSSQN